MATGVVHRGKVGIIFNILVNFFFQNLKQELLEKLLFGMRIILKWP